jgi:hypothetical protein
MFLCPRLDTDATDAIDGSPKLKVDANCLCYNMPPPPLAMPPQATIVAPSSNTACPFQCLSPSHSPRSGKTLIRVHPAQSFGATRTRTRRSRSAEDVKAVVPVSALWRAGLHASLARLAVRRGGVRLGVWRGGCAERRDRAGLDDDARRGNREGRLVWSQPCGFEMEQPVVRWRRWTGRDRLMSAEAEGRDRLRSNRFWECCSSGATKTNLLQFEEYVGSSHLAVVLHEWRRRSRG